MLEPLESRTVMAATITSVDVAINDTVHTVDQNNGVVYVSPGDTVRVAAVRYSVDNDMGGTPTFEGYLRKGDQFETVAYDYSDSVYGGADPDCLLVQGDYEHRSVTGEWVLPDYADRLSISLIRYFGDEVSNESRFHIKMLTGYPNFTVASTNAAELRLETIAPGEKVSILGEWSNLVSGTFLNHAEVDIYYFLNRRDPVWVGTLSGIAGPGETVSGEFLNSKDYDAYEPEFRPARSGLYLIRFTADPEGLYKESNEDDNEVGIFSVVWVNPNAAILNNSPTDPPAVQEDPPQDPNAQEPDAPPSLLLIDPPPKPSPDPGTVEGGVDEVFGDESLVDGLDPALV